MIYNMLNITNIVFWYLFSFNIKKVDITNIILKYLLLKVTSKRLIKKIAFFNYFDKF